MKEVFKFELFYKLLIYVIVLPVLSLLTGWFMKYIISESVIYNFDIIIKLLNIPGILGALLYALIILFFIYIEYVIVYKILSSIFLYFFPYQKQAAVLLPSNLLKMFHVHHKDGGAAHLHRHGHGGVVHHGRAGHVRHIDSDLLSLAAFMFDDINYLLHFIIFHTDHQGGVSLPQKAAGGSELGNGESVNGQLIHNLVFIVFSYDCIYQLHSISSFYLALVYIIQQKYGFGL